MDKLLIAPFCTRSLIPAFTSVQADGSQQPYNVGAVDDIAATKKRGVPYNDPNFTKNFGAKYVVL